jgi:hypothetical protein
MEPDFKTRPEVEPSLNHYLLSLNNLKGKKLPTITRVHNATTSTVKKQLEIKSKKGCDIREVLANSSSIQVTPIKKRMLSQVAAPVAKSFKNTPILEILNS